jgi:cell division septation protein DedD
MKTKDFREVQVSSTLLIVIFLCVLVLGVFIFLLGVSVGKKQVQITAASQVVAQQIQEPARGQASGNAAGQPQEAVRSGSETGFSPNPPAPGLEEKPGAREGPEKVLPESVPGTKTSAAPSAKTPAKPAVSTATGRFFIQVAAFTDRALAAAEADKWRKRGYSAVVTEPRPTDTKTWYRVRLGGYPTREKAAEILTQVNASAKKRTDYRIVKD